MTQAWMVTKCEGTDKKKDADENDRSSDPSHKNDYQIAQYYSKYNESADTNTNKQIHVYTTQIIGLLMLG